MIMLQECRRSYRSLAIINDMVLLDQIVQILGSSFKIFYNIENQKLSSTSKRKLQILSAS